MDTTVYTENTRPEEQRRTPPEGIQGWGADLDRRERPAVPKERTPARLEHVHWESPSHQPLNVEVLHSTERPGLTPVFGSTVPPSGLSGAMRRMAFRYSENDIRHWLMLLMADRVNVGEGLVDDLAHGHIPNIFAEMGGPAEWKYNRAGFVKKAGITAGVVALAVYWMRRRHRY